MDLGDKGDINFNDNDQNLMQNDGELDEQELLDVDNAQQNDENDSETTINFHMQKKVAGSIGFVNQKETNFLLKLMKILL